MFLFYIYFFFFKLVSLLKNINIDNVDVSMHTIYTERIKAYYKIVKKNKKKNLLKTKKRKKTN